jgi:tRNA dimethylallyltransferase
MQATKKELIVIAGPTAVGKTDFAIELARHLNTEIISADSRQVYKELAIGTAKPTQAQLNKVKHHLVGHLSIHDYYNVAKFEVDVLTLLDDLFEKQDQVVIVGGSGLYIDAVCNGIDELPDVDETLRNDLNSLYFEEGIEAIRRKLKSLDPEYYEIIDQSNPKRLIRAVEVCLTTGKKYSELRTNTNKERGFKIHRIALNLERPVLFERINKRVEMMVDDGLLDEAKALFELRHLNALNTVGYKELFGYFKKELSLEQAIENIKTNSRRYAKRQLTWFRKNPNYQWFTPSDLDQVIDLVS